MFHDIDIPRDSRREDSTLLSEEPFIHEGARIVKSRIGSWTEIGRNTTIVESTIGDYTYDDGDVSISYSEIGQYCSIANRVRINPGNHPRDRVTQHHMTYRRVKFGLDTRDDEEFFAWRRAHRHRRRRRRRGGRDERRRTLPGGCRRAGAPAALPVQRHRDRPHPAKQVVGVDTAPARGTLA